MSERRRSRREERRLAKGVKRAGSGSVLRKVAGAGAARRRLQSLILVLVTSGSVAAALLAAQLLAGVNAPFDQAFNHQQGSELTVVYNGSEVGEQQVAASAHARGTTGAAGPYAVALMNHYTANVQGYDLTDFPLPQMELVGRADPGGAVDDVDLISGHWPTADDQIVIATGSSLLAQSDLGTKVTFSAAPGSPTLTIVGFADSVSQSADAWVLPAELTVLSPGTAHYEMLYRFANAGTQAQMTANQQAVTAGMPPGAAGNPTSWLTLQSASSSGGLAIIPPFLAAFGVLGVILAVIILSSVIGSTIGASARRIGVLKAVGCTPAQVVRIYCVQAMIPCMVGVVIGTAAGSFGAMTLLRSTNDALNTGSPHLSTPLEVLVPLASIALIVMTAVLAAGRAGRMSVLDALGTGRTPAAGRGRTAQRILARSPLPRSVSLGLAMPFTRPARALSLMLAVVFGVIAVTFAVGVTSSLNQATADVSQNQGGAQVYVGSQTLGPGGVPTAAQQSAAVAAIEAQPGTEAYETDVDFQMAVSGVSPDATVDEYTGSSWAAYPMISGHWFTGTGQAVAPTHLLRATGLHVGSVITATSNGVEFPLTIVGEVFDTHEDGMQLLVDGSTFGSAQPRIPVFEYNVELKPGTDQASYIAALNTALAHTGSSAAIGRPGGDKLKLIMGALALMMTLMLVAVAALGVIGSVVLDTRERVHDIGVYKAVGMTPRQTTTMVITSVLVLGLIAGVVGVPLGVAVHDFVLPQMGDAVQSVLPPDVLNVYHGLELGLFGLGGLAIALLGALGPAGWAGRIRTSTALRTE